MCNQVEDLSKASNSISTLHSLLELDIQQDSVRQAGSHSRNLLRVKRGLDMVKILFEQILVTEYGNFSFLYYHNVCAKYSVM